MAYEGWLEYDGIEIVNLSRTAQLAQTLNISTVWLRANELQWIQDDLEGVDYFDPTTSPWYDPDYPASVEFAGIIPLSVAGLDDSTLESAPIEYITDGGNSGRPRHTTLPIVSNVVLVGSTERGVEYGLRWMNKMLRQNSNARIVCSGAPLRYFKYGREGSPIVHRRDVSLTRGSSVTRKRSNHCSSSWTVTFTLTAADPFEYGEDHWVVAGLGGPGIEVRRNLMDNGSFETGVDGWVAQQGSDAPVQSSEQAKIGDYSLKFVRGAGSTSAIGVRGDAASLIPGAGNYRIGCWVYVPSTNTSLNNGIRLGGGGVTAFNMTTPIFDEWVWLEAPFTYSGSGSLSPQGWAWPGDGTASPTDTVYIDGLIIMADDGSPIGDYFDGDTPDTSTYRYEWLGTPNESGSVEIRRAGIPGFGEGPFGLGLFGGGAVLSTGELLLIQESCPVYDYSPIYDPLYPALVPSPTAPNFYPDGWTIESGMEFQRYWARVAPLEPSYLDVVPMFRIRSDVEARNVRVSIWPSDSDLDDQCGPLFSAVITYLPANVDFYIDGEQKAAYVWDGSSPVVRRTDSLVYSPDAEPVQWTSFNDPLDLLVTLDLFATDTGYAGEGTLTMDMALVPKTD